MKCPRIILPEQTLEQPVQIGRNNFRKDVSIQKNANNRLLEVSDSENFRIDGGEIVIHALKMSQAI